MCGVYDVQRAMCVVCDANDELPQDHVLESELRQVLPSEKADYLVRVMPPFAGVPDAFDYAAYCAAGGAAFL